MGEPGVPLTVGQLVSHRECQPRRGQEDPLRVGVALASTNSNNSGQRAYQAALRGRPRPWAPHLLRLGHDHAEGVATNIYSVLVRESLEAGQAMLEYCSERVHGNDLGLEKQGGDLAGHQVAHFGEAGGTAGRRPLFTRGQGG